LSYLASIRNRQQPWGRRALGLFAAVWLNLALQPCAMAYALDSPAQMPGHSGMHASMDHEMPCADVMTDCAIVDDINHDGRSAEFKLKDAPVDVVIAIAPHELSRSFGQVASDRSPPRYASVHAGAPPPLNILYCVYLK